MKNTMRDILSGGYPFFSNLFLIYGRYIYSEGKHLLCITAGEGRDHRLQGGYENEETDSQKNVLKAMTIGIAAIITTTSVPMNVYAAEADAALQKAKEEIASANTNATAANERLKAAQSKVETLKENKESLESLQADYYNFMVHYYRDNAIGSAVYDKEGKLDIEASAKRP